MQIDKQLLKQAKQIVSKTNNYSISHLQRNLQIGYDRATVIMQIIQNSQKRYTRLYAKRKKRFRFVS